MRFRHLPWIVATTLLLTAPMASARAKGPSITLLPGSVAGSVDTVGMHHGETARWIAMRYGVNPVRVSGEAYGSLQVDTRHVVPAFDPAANGIVLNVPEAEVYLVQAGEIVRHYPVAVSAPDKPVRLGYTRVVSKQKNPPWYIPVSIQKELGRYHKLAKVIVPPGPRNPLGPRWLGFWDGNFGFHGTNVPTSIKQYASHGCVRFRATDIKDLYDRVEIGTPVHVVYQPVVLGVDDSSIWLQVYPDIYKQKYDYHAAVASLARSTGIGNKLNWKAVSRAILRHDGIITNVGPSASGFREASDPTASQIEAVSSHGDGAAVAAVVHRKPRATPHPVTAARPAAPRYVERLIPQDQLLAPAEAEPDAPLPGSTPGAWYSNP